MKKQLYALLFLFLFFHSAHMNAQSMQFENQIIEKINIDFGYPVENIEQSILSVKNRLHSREGDFFSQSVFDSDLKDLIREFDRVEPQVESQGGKITLFLTLWPKPVIRSINFQGNNTINTSKLQKELDISPGILFDRQSFNTSFHKLKTFYVTSGYFEASLTYQAEYDFDTNEVDINICIEEGRAGRIKSICFQNFTYNEQCEILDLMCTKKYNAFTSWFFGTGLYQEDVVQQDKFIIVNFLQNRGFADAKVDIDIVESGKNKIDIIITADRGPRYFLGDVTIEGCALFPEGKIRELMTFCEGDPYSPEEIHNSIKKITNLYGSRGYIEAFVDYAPKLAEGECRYNLDISIEEGEQFRVGLIKIIGNTATQTQVILHETLLVPGEVFNSAKLKITEIKLLNVGFFETVNVYAVESECFADLPGNYRDIIIEVEECSTGNFGAFFGASSSESVFGGLNLTERNFNYKGLCCFWEEGYRALRGGGEYAHITATIGAKTRSYVLSWTKPYYKDTPWTVGFDLQRSVNNAISNDYTINTTGLNVHGTYPVNPFVRAGVHWRVENNTLDIKKKTKTEKDREQTKDLEEEKKETGWVTATGASLMYNSTNHPIRPTCGFKSLFETEIAILEDHRAFASFAYLNSYYWDIGKGAYFNFRADFRFLQPFHYTSANEIPLDERFFLGGDSLVRGYRPYKLGPQFPGNDPKGGVSLQLYSLEYIYPVYSSVDAFLFFDAGSLSGKTWVFSKIYPSVGYGVRISVFGPSSPPLTLGMGYPVVRVRDGDVKKFFLMVGGRF